jgi:hypothetical protein
MTRHHRKPKSLGGGMDNRNIALLPNKKHEAWHFLFSNLPPERIVQLINSQFLDPDYQLILERKQPFTAH